jgi:hypothetical protein
MKRIARLSWVGLVGLVALAGCKASSNASPDGGGDGGVCMSSAVRPSARKDVQAVLATSASGPQVYVFGGDEAPFDPNAMSQPKQLVDELWRYDLGCKSWEQLTAPGPGPRAGYAAALDDHQNRILYVGGRAGSGMNPPLVNDVWALDLSTLAFSQLHPTGTAPSPRLGHRVVFDSAANRLLLVGGDTSQIFGNGIVGDVWQLDFSASPDGAWTQLSATGATGAPPARRDASFAIDPMHKIAVMFGGAFTFSSYTNEVWIYDLGANTWKQAQPVGGAPSERFGARMGFSSVSGQMVLFGGHDAGAIGLRNDTFSLTADATGLAVFTQLLPGDAALGVGNVDLSSPERREKDGFVVAPGIAFTFGGTSDCGPLDDTWTLDLTQPTAWMPTFPAMVGETCARRAMPGQMCPSDCGSPL